MLHVGGVELVEWLVGWAVYDKFEAYKFDIAQAFWALNRECPVVSLFLVFI